MTDVTLRSALTRPLTWTEMDANFDNVRDAIDNHIADTADAHDASAISNVAAGNLVATDVQAALNELDTEKAALAGATFTGDVTITSDTFTVNGNAAVTRIIIDANNNVGKLLSWRTDDVQRWAARVDGNETGSNVGADFAIRRYNDAGTFVDSPLAIVRSTGTSTFTGIVSLATGQLQFPAAQNASSNANTLDDYEEGTWTPADGSGAGLSFTGVSGIYIKIGRVVHFYGELQYPSTADGSNAIISGLPFTSTTGSRGGAHMNYCTETTLVSGVVNSNAMTIGLYNNAGAALTNANMSTDVLSFSGSYPAAA